MTYSGEIVVRFTAWDIECDGSLHDFLAQIIPEGWEGEADIVSGHIDPDEEDEPEE